MLGDELRRARRAAGLTQEQLGFKAGLSREYISILECNKKSPTVETLLRICKVLDVRSSRILARVEKTIGNWRQP